MNALYLLSCLTLFIQTSKAHPLVAGHCDAGGDLGTKSFGNHGTGGGDSLYLGGIRAKIDGVSLDTLSTRTLQSQTSYTLRLETDFDFKGFLIRLSGTNGLNVKGTLGIKSGFGDSSQELSICADDVDGISHTNRLVKTAVEVDFLYEKSTAGDLQLDITVVKNNNSVMRDDWFFSRFNLKMETGDPSPTPPPTPGPTPNPTRQPTPSPTSDDESGTFVYKLQKQTSPNGDVTKTPILQTCQWLQSQTSEVISSVCTKPRHNKHGILDDILYGPASNVCSNTCSSYCRKEFNNAPFLMKVKKNGDLKIQRCKNLKKKTEWKINQICGRSFDEVDTLYSPASKVCTKTCGTTC